MWKSLRPRLELARGLSLADWLALTEAWAALIVFYFAIRRMSYECLSATRLSTHAASSGLMEARRLHRLVGWAARLHLLPMTCLVQSLTLRWALARRGIVSELKIGVQRSGSKSEPRFLKETRVLKRDFRAHAWLEVNGEKVGESEDIGGIFRLLRGVFPPSAS